MNYRCQNVCLEHYESSKQKFREELEATCTEEKERLEQELHKQIEKLRWYFIYTVNVSFSFRRLIDINTLIKLKFFILTSFCVDPVFCRSELSSTQRELDKAKEMYISVCEAKDKLEDDVNRRLQEQVEKEVQEVSLSWQPWTIPYYISSFWLQGNILPNEVSHRVQGCHGISNLDVHLFRDVPGF